MEKLIKILGKSVVEVDGIKIEVELRMSERDYPTKGEIIFKPYCRFKSNKIVSPIHILRKRYLKEFKNA